MACVSAGVFASFLLVEADNVTTILDFDFFELQRCRVSSVSLRSGLILIQGASLLSTTWPTSLVRRIGAPTM